MSQRQIFLFYDKTTLDWADFGTELDIPVFISEEDYKRLKSLEPIVDV